MVDNILLVIYTSAIIYLYWCYLKCMDTDDPDAEHLKNIGKRIDNIERMMDNK